MRAKCRWIGASWGLLGCFGASLWDPQLKITTVLKPEAQNGQLLNTTSLPLRPMLPRARPPTIYIELATFSDNKRCGHALYTAFRKAANPWRVQVGLIEAPEKEESCVEVYCRYVYQRGMMSEEECPYLQQIHVITTEDEQSQDVEELRTKMQQSNDFCLHAHAATHFEAEWDNTLLQTWIHTGNEMAILTTAPVEVQARETWPEFHYPHICSARRRGDVWIQDAPATIMDTSLPQITTFWSDKFSFGKCHAYTATRKRYNTNITSWIGDASWEIYHGAALWTMGYDFYSPSKIALYVDYTDHHVKQVPPNQESMDSHTLRARSIESYVSFAGFNEASHTNSCKQHIWVPYDGNLTHVHSVVEMQLNHSYFHPPYEALPGIYKPVQGHSSTAQEKKSSVKLTFWFACACVLGILIYLFRQRLPSLAFYGSRTATHRAILEQGLAVKLVIKES